MNKSINTHTDWGIPQTGGGIKDFMETIVLDLIAEKRKVWKKYPQTDCSKIKPY